MSKARALEKLKKTLESAEGADDERGVGGDESVSEALSTQIFSSYATSCAAIDRGIAHPGDIAEATSLSAIRLPETSYPLWDSLPASIVDSGKLSQLQLEGVICACTKHQQFLPNGQRAGFFLGDGAGVGKGRQISGVILDNYARGRRRAVWLSTSSDLHFDAERDLKSLGCHIGVINNCQHLDRETRVMGLAKDMQEGVLFMTYTTLTSTTKGHGRLQQVIDWAGGPDFDGCLIFDESHKSKNFVPGKEAQSTKVAASVLELQEKLPKARVLYASATGVSEVGNLAYMTRLGLWGPGTSFVDFGAFLDSMKQRGVSFLEMLAMEMKGQPCMLWDCNLADEYGGVLQAEGYYLARSLSFRDAEFSQLECKLTKEQAAMYDGAVQLWQDMRAGLATALEMTGSRSKEVWKPYWSAQQRFFKLLCVSLKVPYVIKEAQTALAEGQAVVVGLQSTGEAAADAMGLEPGKVCGFLSTTREMLHRFVTNHFPTQYEANTSDVVKPEMAGKSEPVSAAAKAALLDRIEQLDLPANFLDELIDKLGGAGCVAEMTGRKGRIVRIRGRGVYELRAKPDSVEMDSLNVKETAAFMKGAKLVAIVSDAASTGISLHASADAKNQRRRVHLTIELPWSADKAIQQLGRSHRSNQASAPIYKLMVTELGGEKRFASAVARRLQSLGALTRGDRRAASGIDLSESNLDNPLGRKALRRMYDHIVQESQLLPPGVALPAVLEGSSETDQDEILQMVSNQEGTVSAAELVSAVQRLHAMLRDAVSMMAVGAELPRSDTVAEDTRSVSVAPAAKELGDVRRFLNRMLGMPVARQALLFGYFAATLAAEIQSAKAEGRYFEGVSDLSGSNISRAGDPQVLWVDSFSQQSTMRHDLTVDRGMPFEVAIRRLAHERAGPDDNSGFRRSKRPMFGRDMILLATRKPGAPGVFNIARPNTGASFFDMDAEELRSKYVRITEEQAKEGWNELYTVAASCCMHGMNCALGPECQVGKRKTPVTILAGSVVRVWGALEAVLSRHEHSLSKSDRTMRAVHVTFPDGSSLIGIRYPARLLDEVVTILRTAQAMLKAPSGETPNGEAAGAKMSHLSVPSKSQAAVQAAAMGASMRSWSEPVSPVHQASLSKAFRPPRTVLDFFKPRDAKAAAAATASNAARKPAAQQQQPQAAQQRTGAAKALAEISMNADHPNKKPKYAAPAEAIDLISASETVDLTSDMTDVRSNGPAGKRPRLSNEPQPQQQQQPDGQQQTEADLDADTQQQAKPDRTAHPRKGNNAMQSRQPAAQKKPPDPQPGGEAEDKTAAIFKRRLSSSHMPPSHLIAELTGMGFSYEHAVKALRASNGDVQRAVNWAVDIAGKKEECE